MSDLTIRPLREGEPHPYDLLLSADPSEAAVHAYIFHSTVYIDILRNRTDRL